MATVDKSKSSNKKTKNSKQNKQKLHIKILLASLIVVVLCFFAYFLATKNSSKVSISQQQIELPKKDGTQKTIEDINRYLDKQDKNEILTPELKQKESQVRKIDTIIDKLSKEVSNIESKVETKIDINLTKKSLRKVDENLSKEANLTNKQMLNDRNISKNLEQNITKKIDKVEPKKQELKEDKTKEPKPKIEQKVIKKVEFKKSSDGHESEIKVTWSRPRLVLIIDDVATMQQASAIKSIPLHLTPSIFPATKGHPDTPQIAKGFSFYMIHLPMQAMSNDGAEIGTLKVGDSIERMTKTLQNIKRDFPNLKFINNHTGSRFTSDFESMDKFMSVVKNEGITFMDSKTIANTKVYDAAKKYGMRYIARDVFLDHDGSKAAVTSQLKYALKLAKEKGYAIAIGHPHKNTLEVIKSYTKEILKEVDVVYLKEIL